MRIPGLVHIKGFVAVVDGGRCEQNRQEGYRAVGSRAIGRVGVHYFSLRSGRATLGVDGGEEGGGRSVWNLSIQNI